MTLFLELLAVAALILLNAFFVAAEYGLVTARRTRIIELHHQGNRRARDVLRITSDPPRFIAAMQLGVTLTTPGHRRPRRARARPDVRPLDGVVPRDRPRVPDPHVRPRGDRRARAEGHRARPLGGHRARGRSAGARVLHDLLAARLGAPALHRVRAHDVRPRAAGRRGRRDVRGRAEDAALPRRPSTARSSRRSRRCSTRSSTSPTRRPPT